VCGESPSRRALREGESELCPGRRPGESELPPTTAMANKTMNLLGLFLSLWPVLTQQRCSYTVAIGAREDTAALGLPAAVQRSSRTFSDYLTATAGRRLQSGSGCPGPVTFDVIPAATDSDGVLPAELLSSFDFGYLSHSTTSCLSVAQDYTPLLRTVAVNESAPLSSPFAESLSGSVLLAMAGSGGMSGFSDVKGKKVGSTTPESVFDWMLAAQALLREGVYLSHDASQVAFFGLGTAGAARCMRAVLEGAVDVCAVASHKAEAIFRTGDMHPAEFKFLGPSGSRSCTHGGLLECVHTQVLAPEQHFFGARPGVSWTAVREVSQALLDFNSSNAAALTSEGGHQQRFMEPMFWHRLNTVLHDLLILGYDPASKVSSCDLRKASVARCPPGFMSKTPSEIEVGCSAIGMECPSPRCMCNPCTKNKNWLDVFMEVAVGADGGPQGTNATRETLQCEKMARCATVEIDSIVVLTVMDSQHEVYGEGTITYILHSSEECSEVVVDADRFFWGANGTVSGIALADAENPGRYTATISIPSAGNLLLEVFINGTQIPDSPSWVTVVNKPCSEGSLRLTINGPCMCEPWSYPISGKCVRASVLLPSAILPVFALLALAAYVYHVRAEMAIGASWVIAQDDITFFDPQEVLGVGTFGWVVAGAYKGFNVAIRRAIPNEHDIQTKKARKRITMKGLQNLSRAPSLSASRLRSAENADIVIAGMGSSTGKDLSGHPSNLSMQDLSSFKDTSGHRKIGEGLNGSSVAKNSWGNGHFPRPRSISVQHTVQSRANTEPSNGTQPSHAPRSVPPAGTMEMSSTMQSGPTHPVQSSASLRASSCEPAQDPALGSIHRPRVKSLTVETSNNFSGGGEPSAAAGGLISPAARFIKERLPPPSPKTATGPRSLHERASIRTISRNSLTLSPSMDGDISWAEQPTPTGKNRFRRTYSMGQSNSMVAGSFNSPNGSFDLDGQVTLQRLINRVGVALGMKPVASKKKHTFQSLKKELIQNMKVVSKLKHPNIITIHGAIVHNTNVPMLVMEKMDNGSLYDVLYSGTASLEGEIMVSILRDISSGMAYLHSANVVHGDLKPDHILMDAQFRAKISGYGFNFKHMTGIEESFTPWAAPEVLLGCDCDMRSDVYSFGITVWELFTRRVPFEEEDAYYAMLAVCSEPGEGEEPYRPLIPSNCPTLVAKLMHTSWAQDPDLRPTFADLGQQIAVLDLTGRQATNDVLFDVFPKHVAEKLIAGEKVDPEKKECVSIFFSDIVGFTNLSDVMDASAVSDMLDRLYTKLDAISREMNVFKVETIGDAFIACTNLVEEQEDHAARLALFALAAMEAAHNTPVQESDPSKGSVQIRVGLHCGPVVASVIGTRKKKYCLLGDTVNTASRMESHGLPGHIHISRTIAKMIKKHAPGLILEPRGLIDIKGKGRLQTYFLKGGSYSLSHDPNGADLRGLSECSQDLETPNSPTTRVLAQDLDASISLHNCAMPDTSFKIPRVLSTSNRGQRLEPFVESEAKEKSPQMCPKDISKKMRSELQCAGDISPEGSQEVAHEEAQGRQGHEKSSFMGKALSTIGSLKSPRRVSRSARAHSHTFDSHGPLPTSGTHSVARDHSAPRTFGPSSSHPPSRSLPMRIKDALTGKSPRADRGASSPDRTGATEGIRVFESLSPTSSLGSPELKRR